MKRKRFKTRLRSRSGEIRESTAKGLKLTLMREGRSRNGIVWDNVLESVAKYSKGVSVQVLEFEKSRFKTFFDHIRNVAGRFPSRIRSMLPDVFPGSIIGLITEASVIGKTPNRRVDGFLELQESAGWFGKLIQRMSDLGSSLPGVSIVVKKPHFGVKLDRASSSAVVTRLSGISHYDVVTHPSAGGSIEALIESTIGGFQPMRFWDLLLKMVPGRKRRLEKEIVEGKRDDLTLETLMESHSEIADEFREALVSSGAVDKVKDDDEDDEDDDDEGLEESEEDEDDPDDDDDEDEEDEESDEEKEKREALHLKKKKNGKKKGKDSPKGGGKGKFGKGKKKKPGEDDDDMRESNDRRLTKLETERCNDTLDSKLRVSKLPKQFRGILRRRFQDTIFESKDLDQEIKIIKKACAKKADADDQIPDGSNPMIMESGLDSHTKVLDAFEALFEGVQKHPDSGVPAFRGIRDAYQRITGDMNCEGETFFARHKKKKPFGALCESVDFRQLDSFNLWTMKRHGGNEDTALMEAVTTGGFPLLLADVMHNKMVRDYVENDLQAWRQVASVTSVNDFRTWREERFGEYPALPTVVEGAPYVALASPSEEQITMQIVKRGGTENITWETIVNDRVGFVTKIPEKLSKAAAWTLFDSFFQMFELNETIYDATALGTAGHNNFLTVALSQAQLTTVIQAMKVQQDIDTIRPIRLRPKFLLVPTELYDLAVQLTGDIGDNTVQLSSAISNPNRKYGITVLEMHHWTDATDWVMAADPALIEGAQVAFLNGQEEPSLFIQDMQNVGSMFDNDTITYKVRHVWDRIIKDFRAYSINTVAG